MDCSGGVFVLTDRFGVNVYVTGALTGYSAHRLFLIVLGGIKGSASTGSVDTFRQWRFYVGLRTDFVGSASLESMDPELSIAVRWRTSTPDFL